MSEKPTYEEIEKHVLELEKADFNRKKAEDELQETERNYTELIELSPVGIFTSSSTGKALFVNPEMARMLGANSTQEAIDNFGDLAKDLYVDPNRLKMFISMLKDKGKIENFEYEARGLDGKRLWLSMNARSREKLSDETFIIDGFTVDITERKRAEDAIKLNEARLESLLRINQHPTENIQELLDYALNEAITLTRSKIGYIYFYDEAKKEFVLNTWSKEVMLQCTVAEPQTIYKLEKTGIWGEAVRHGQPIVINDFSAPNPLKKGVPEGHAPLNKFLTLPVFSEGHIVAVVGVANKMDDYNDSDIRQLNLMMDAVWRIAL